MILGKGLEVSGEWTFAECTSIHKILIPNAVKAIKKQAFAWCFQMTIVVYGEGLEVIEEAAFAHCTSLQEILIPNAVKAIKNGAFYSCSQLTTVNLGKGLRTGGDWDGSIS